MEVLLICGEKEGKPVRSKLRWRNPIEPIPGPPIDGGSLDPSHQFRPISCEQLFTGENPPKDLFADSDYYAYGS